MRDKLCLLVWALTLHIVPLHAQEVEDHSNDDIQNPNTPIKLVRPFPCIPSPLFPYFRSQTPTVSLHFCPKTHLLSIAQFLHGPYLTNPPKTDNKFPLRKHIQTRPNPQPLPIPYKTLPRRLSFLLIQLRHLALLRLPPRRPRTHIPHQILTSHMALPHHPIMAIRLRNSR